jgi:phosphate-selective porin
VSARHAALRLGVSSRTGATLTNNQRVNDQTVAIDSCCSRFDPRNRFAISRGRVHGQQLPEGFPALRGRTQLDASFYRPDFWVKGHRRRIGVEARWRPGPFSFKGEYIRLTDERLGQSVEDTDLSALLATGWYISGTWAVTGENKADGLDSPRRPLFRGGFGALEVAARVERLSFGSVATDGVPSTSPRADVVLGNADRADTIGVNWYANRWIKIQFNLIRERIADQPGPCQPDFWSRVVRFQFSL